MPKKEKVRKMKGMKIIAEKQRKKEIQKADKALQKIFDDNTTGR